jgi:hypothetical protein
MDQKPNAESATRISIDEAEKQITDLTIERDNLKIQLDDVTKQLSAATDILQADLRSKLSQRIRTLTNYTPDQLAKMSLDELEVVANVAQQTKTPHKNIHFPGANVDEPEEHPLNRIFADTWEKKK